MRGRAVLDSGRFTSAASAVDPDGRRSVQRSGAFRCRLCPSRAFNRLISAYLSGVSRVCASRTILVSRLARRPRRRREAPSGNVRRNISRVSLRTSGPTNW